MEELLLDVSGVVKQAKVLEQEKKSETEAAIAIQQCYRHVPYPSRAALGGAGSVHLAHSVIDIQNASDKPGSGQVQVVRQLQSQNKLRDAADAPESPSFIRDRTPLKAGSPARTIVTPRRRCVVSFPPKTNALAASQRGSSRLRRMIGEKQLDGNPLHSLNLLAGYHVPAWANDSELLIHSE